MKIFRKKGSVKDLYERLQKIYQENKHSILLTGVLLVFLSIFCFIWYGNGEDSSNDRDTVQQLETELGRTGDELSRARTELQHGQETVVRIENGTANLERTNEESRQLIRDSRRIVEESKRTFREIDEANGITKTQAGCEGKTK